MKITHKIDIHLDKYRPEAEIVVMQCDANTRELQFMLYSNDAAWPIPEAAKIYVGYSKPDGTGGFYDTLPDGVGACTVESNTVTAVLAEQVLTVPGKVFVSVSLQEEGQILATFAVQLNVKPKPGIAVMQSENYFCLKALIDAATVAAQKPVQVITVSKNADGGYVSSHYLSGIQSIINLQLPVACHWYEQDVTLCLVEYQNGGPFTFAAVSNAIEYRVVIKSDEDISCTMTELVRSDKIPVTSVNGQTGAVAVSTAVQVQVWQKNDGSYDYSHNSLRIMNALSAGNTVFCQLGTHYLLSLVYATPAKCIFTGVYEGELYAVTVTSTGATVTTTPLSSGGGGADGLLFDETTGTLYLMQNGQILGNGVQLPATGDGPANNAVLTLANTTGWSNKTIPNSQPACTVSFDWSSVEGDVSTGDGTLAVKVAGELWHTAKIRQGEHTLNILDYLSIGYNLVHVTVTDFYGNTQTIPFGITMYDPAALKSTKLVERTLTGDYTNDRATKIGAFAFAGLTLDQLSLPGVTEVAENGFNSINVKELEMASLTETTYWMFRDGRFDVVKVPSVAKLNNQSLFAWYINRMVLNRVNLEFVDDVLTSKNNVVTFDFDRLKSLPRIPGGSTRNVIIRTPEVCALQTPPGTTSVNVYVPASMVDRYKSETNWSAMADQIFAIEDHPDICEVSDDD